MKKTRNALARAVATAIGASALLIAGAAQAALQDRDLDGDSVVDAIYDTDLDITWLRNANVNGTMNWESAVAWADGFSFAGYDDWRLPTTLQPDPSCSRQSGDVSDGRNCTRSEMGHLWYVELGNSGSMTNTGNFQNLQHSTYWSGTEYAPNPSGFAWYFHTGMGTQYAQNKNVPKYAMAVRAGDVAAIPEPQTYALLLAGLGALFVARRRRAN